MVIGVVIDKLGDHFKVDIGAAAPATLSAMSFEGATKKNRPNLQVGSLLYARVILANKDMDPELSCMSVRSKAEGFGELYGGYMFKCTLSHAYA
jgi:exosome complex component RRP40